MRLLEFQSSLLLRDAYKALSGHFRLERVGGEQRVYTVNGSLGVVYLVNGGPKAIGLVWAQGSSQLASIYLWKSFNAMKSPDFVAQIPVGLPDDVLKSIINFIERPHSGAIMESREATVADFIAMLKSAGYDLSGIREDDLHTVAMQNGVIIPRAILTDPRYRNADGFNLEAENIEKSRRIYIMAKDAKGVLFQVPGMEEAAARLEQKFAAAHGSEEGTMEEQYEKLREKVELVAGNKSTYIKSLLITGAPSSGKTFTVMQTVKNLGLVEGRDYIVIKGSITDAALYQTFIEQIDSLTIFDDCDSVAKTTDGKNMLKNALDTYEVRDIGRPMATSINTKQMSAEERTDFVNAVSRILRGVPEKGDLDRFDQYLPKKKKKVKEDSRRIPKFRDFDDNETSNRKLTDSDAEKLVELQRFFQMYPPNRIDFRGRIIFISNMKESEWDSAILTRAFRQNMSFSDDEMLDFIEKIKNSIAAPQLTDEQKDEVLAFIRECHENGELQSPINFRLVQQSFDLRLCSQWKQMIRAL